LPPKWSCALRVDLTDQSANYLRIQLPSPELEEYSARQMKIYIGLVSFAGVLLLLNLTGILVKVYLIDTALIVTLLWGIPIYWKAIDGFFHKKIEAEVLVTVAAIASVAGTGLYLVAGEVILIMLIGEALEAYAVDKTRTGLKEIVALSPKRARIRRGDTEFEVPVEEVRKGDLVIVKSGERIPVDGLVRSGIASVNQGPITGESIPMDKTKGAEVYTGSLLELGMLEIETSKVGEDTTLARVIQLTEAAQEEKGNIQRLADKAASYFVVTALAIFVVVLLLTMDPLRASSVIIIACPCALVLATPTAVVAAVGNAAKHGILIKGGIYLESLGRVNALVIDKTGTVTVGEPHVTDVLGFGRSQDDVVALAAVCERFSEHALATAIIEHAQKSQVQIGEPEEFKVLPGLGVVARKGSQHMVVGNRKLMAETHIEPRPDTEEAWDRLEMEGKTPVGVAVEGELVGLIGVADVLRQDAKDAFARLSKLKLQKTVMLTGDNPSAAKRIAEQLGLSDVRAQLLPEDKISAIRELKKLGFSTIMVGDGINDAPALAMADVGIAMGAAGADTAVEASNVVLMSNDLMNIDRVIRLGRRTLRTIRQNIIYFALLYNGVGILLGSLGLITPLVAAVAHQFSSLFVILNSLRLLRYKFD